MYSDDGDVKCFMCGRGEAGTRIATKLDQQENRSEYKDRGDRKLNAQDERWVLGLDAHIPVPKELYGELDNVATGL